MAEFISKCPHCQSDLQLQEEWEGMAVECPICSKRFSVRKNIPKEKIQKIVAKNLYSICTVILKRFSVRKNIPEEKIQKIVAKHLYSICTVILIVLISIGVLITGVIKKIHLDKKIDDRITVASKIISEYDALFNHNQLYGLEIRVARKQLIAHKKENSLTNILLFKKRKTYYSLSECDKIIAQHQQQLLEVKNCLQK